MNGCKITQCDKCGVILDQKKDIDLEPNTILLCYDCYYKFVLTSSLESLPVINDHVESEVFH